MKDKILYLINSKLLINSIQLDELFIYCISKIFIHSLNYFDNIKNFIDIDILEIDKQIIYEMNKYILIHLNRCLNNTVSENNLNEFMKIYLLLIDILNDYCKRINFNPTNLFSKFENGINC